ncbi:MAG: thioredoxin domain-containing protein [Ornithinimicrobium sp.]
MSTVTLTEETFDAAVTDSEIILVDWWAQWCGPCKQFGPIFEEAATRHTDVVFGKVDTEAQPGLASGAQITSIPTIMAFRDGILVFAQPGALPAPALESLVSQVKELDMDDVRAKVAEQEHAETHAAGGERSTG